MVKFYKVGGCVRDEILGLKSKDIDYAVEASSYDQMKQEILNLGGKIFLEKPEYLTIRGHLFGDAADFVLCRKDGVYSDNRRPDNVEIGTLADDLSRRDFTMNALAKDSNGKIIDIFGGVDDIQSGVIRLVGGTERLTEDPLRILRALRFSLTKHMSISYQIAEFLMKKDLRLMLKSVSQERIVDEVNKMFEFSAIRTLKLLDEYNLLECVFNKRTRTKIVTLSAS